MKKLFAIIAVAGLLTACDNDEAAKKEAEQKAADSTRAAFVADSIKNAEAAKAKTDSPAVATPKADSPSVATKVAEGANKMMDKAADAVKEGANKMVDKAKEAVKK